MEVLENNFITSTNMMTYTLCLALFYVRAMAVNKAGKALFSVLRRLLLTFQNGKERLQLADCVLRSLRQLFPRDKLKS